MPSTLEQLTLAWREEVSRKTRRTVPNQSPFRTRKLLPEFTEVSYDCE